MDRAAAPPAALVRDPAVLLSVAGSKADRRRLRLEELGRDWALAHGIPTPHVVASDGHGRWLASERVDDVADLVPLVDALDLAARISRAPTPRFKVPSSDRSDPLGRPFTALLLTTIGVSPSTFLRLRAAAAALPRTATAHGSFHPGNVIMSETGPLIVGWEHLGPGHPHQDTLQYLSMQPLDVSLPEVESMLLGVGRVERRGIVVCFRWLTLRNLTAHVSHRSRAMEDVTTLRTRWRAVDEFSAAIGGRI